jgi:uncharacterized protein YndB with AHSA1/START domain
MSFDVACSAEHAFHAWTSGIAAWWPPDHKASGDPSSVVVLQGAVGGRIYERTSEGVEHEWGEVTVWEPPARLAYRWHLGRDPDAATEVDVTFLARGTGETKVEIEQRGWEQFGAAAEQWRDRNSFGWQAVIPYFIRAMQDGDN